METAEPKSNGQTAERDARGRFLPGNKAAKGHQHPHARRAVKLAEAFSSAVKAADIKAIAKKLVEMARNGDLQAIRELLDRTLGRPALAELAEDETEVKVIRWPIAPPPARPAPRSAGGATITRADDISGESESETSNDQGA